MFTRSTPRSILPKKMAKPAAPRRFWSKTERRREPFGLTDAIRTRAPQAILQMAGPRGHIACRDDAHSETATADPRPNALVVRRTVQASAFRVHRIRYRPLSHSWP